MFRRKQSNQTQLDALQIEVRQARQERDQLEERLHEELRGLKREKAKLTDDLDQLKLKHKIEEEDIKHMVKLKMERNDLDFERKCMEAERAKDDAIAAVKDEYRDKTETQLVDQKNDIMELNSQILERLPNVRAKLTGQV